MRSIEAGDLKGLSGKLENVLERETGREYPVIGEIELVMKSAGALAAIMSGSGPTVFGIFEERKTAERAMERIREKNLAKEVFLSGFQAR